MEKDSVRVLIHYRSQGISDPIYEESPDFRGPRYERGPQVCTGQSNKWINILGKTSRFPNHKSIQWQLLQGRCLKHRTFEGFVFDVFEAILRHYSCKNFRLSYYRINSPSYISIKLLTKNTTYPLFRFYTKTMQRRPKHPIIILFPYMIGIL